jgi:hypothetical protein
LDGFDDGREGVPEDHGTPGAEVVDVAVAIGVPEVGAFAADDEGRVAADGAKGTDRRVDSAGKNFFCALPERTGAGENERHVSSIGADEMTGFVRIVDTETQ